MEKPSRFRNWRCRCEAVFSCWCNAEGEGGGALVVVVQEQPVKFPVFFYSLCYLGGMHFRMITLKSTINRFPSVLTYKKAFMIHSATIIGCKPCSRHCTGSKEKSQEGKYILKLIFWVALLYGNTKCLPKFYDFLYCFQIANYVRIFEMNGNKLYWVPLYNFTES